MKVWSQNPDDLSVIKKGELSLQSQKIVGIDNLDTITFDLSQAVCSNGTVTFPISISSDDVIWALDFSMKWDLTKATYNSIISHKPYLMPTANYNTGDSTLRFSSFSLLAMEHNVALVSVKLDLIAGQINTEDLEIVSVLLNGSACSYKIIDGPQPAAVNVVGDISILPGDTTTLVANSTAPGCTYQWSTSSGSNLIFVTSPGTYTVTVTNTNGCSSTAFATISLANPLPVELLNFTARQLGRNVLLEWSTGSEHNNSHFNLFRSHDMDKKVLIATVAGIGNSSTVNSYKLSDDYPVNGVNYYFLEQHDLNGAIKEYPPIIVYVTGLNRDIDVPVRVFPNPLTESEFHFIGDPMDSDAIWMICSAEGMKVNVISVMKVSGDDSVAEYLIVIPASLPAGMYMLTCIDSENSQSARFFIQEGEH